ncbi:MAG: hypothetical protein GX376_08480 [Firmicutes bacterium]|nr:hypothetical protein [Bacillota bacterium]
MDEYKHIYEDPIAHFREVAKLRTLKVKKEKRKKEIHLGSVFDDGLLVIDEDAIRLLGNIPLSPIYHELNLNQFIINRQRSPAMDYSLNDVMQLLIYTRILSPGFKRHSFAQKEKLAGSYKCDEYDVYRALDYFDRFTEELLVHLHEGVRYTIIQETRRSYGLGRIITVADKGLNSGDNIAFLMARGDGFIFSQKIRGADTERQRRRSLRFLAVAPGQNVGAVIDRPWPQSLPTAPCFLPPTTPTKTC